MSAPRAAGALLALAVLAGCASTQGPDAGELAAVRDGRAAIVLLRVVTTSSGGPVSAFATGLGADSVTVGLAEAGGDVEQIDVASFSDAALEDGWIVLVLPPGEHVVAFNPPTTWDARGAAERWADAIHWQLTVPTGTAVAYAGTMQLHCRVERSDFGGLRVREIRAERLRDESPAAAALAAGELPGLPAPRRTPLVRLDARASTILHGVR